MRRSFLTGAPVAAALVIACGRERTAPLQTLDVDHRTAPARTVTLREDRDVPLEFLFLVLSDDSTLLAVERRTQDIWRIPIREPGTATRVGQASARGRERITGVAVFEGRISMIDLRGVISEDAPSATNPLIVAHRRIDGPRALLGFARLADATFVLLESRTSVVSGGWQPADTVTLLQIFRPDSQVVLRHWARSDRRRPLGIASDFFALQQRSDTLYVTGSDPARVMPVVVASKQELAPVQFDGLTGVAMGAPDAERVVSGLVRRGVPGAEAAKVPKVYPPVVSALPAAAGWFVVTSTGAARFALVHFCPAMPVRALVSGTDIASIHLLNDHIVFVRDALADGRMVVEVSRTEDFTLTCNR